MKQYPNKATIESMLDYNPESGVFVWKSRPDCHFISKSRADAWNRMYAGKLAGVKDGKYIRITISKQKYVAHRLAWIVCKGEELNFIDHINHNGYDNRIVNLRSVSHRENLMNMSLKKSNKSGVTGVYFEKQTGKWRSYINVLGKSIKLGRFDDLDQAVKSRLSAEKHYGFHENHGIKIE